MIYFKQRRTGEHNIECGMKIIYILYLTLPPPQPVYFIYEKMSYAILFCKFGQIEQRMGTKPYIIQRHI